MTFLSLFQVLMIDRLDPASAPVYDVQDSPGGFYAVPDGCACYDRISSVRVPVCLSLDSLEFGIVSCLVAAACSRPWVDGPFSAEVALLSEDQDVAVVVMSPYTFSFLDCGAESPFERFFLSRFVPDGMAVYVSSPELVGRLVLTGGPGELTKCGVISPRERYAPRTLARSLVEL